MSRAARSVGIFGAYLVVLAVVLIVAPNTILGLFGIADTHEVWLRVTGVIVGNVGVYYLVAARHELRPIIAASIPVRLALMAFFALFVMRDYVRATLLFFGAGDVAGALWTWWELRRERHGKDSART